MKQKVKVNNLHKYFGKLEVLRGVDVEIKEGEVVCVIGPSGGGKSTFLRCLNRLEEVTDGEIIVDDHVITDKKADINKIREKIGMVFQCWGSATCPAVSRPLPSPRAAGSRPW